MSTLPCPLAAWAMLPGWYHRDCLLLPGAGRGTRAAGLRERRVGEGGLPRHLGATLPGSEFTRLLPFHLLLQQPRGPAAPPLRELQHR